MLAQLSGVPTDAEVKTCPNALRVYRELFFTGAPHRRLL